MPLSPAAAHFRARLAGLARTNVPQDDPRYAEARHGLRVAVLVDRATRLAEELAALQAGGAA